MLEHKIPNDLICILLDVLSLISFSLYGSESIYETKLLQPVLSGEVVAAKTASASGQPSSKDIRRESAWNAVMPLPLPWTAMGAAPEICDVRSPSTMSNSAASMSWRV